MFPCDLCHRGGHCGGCRRSNSTEKPHTFQVILTEHQPLELSAENELEMADWMLLLCQSVSKGIIPQGVAPAPCIPCCLVLTDRKLLTCHQDCQTSFFRSLGGADLNDVTAVCLEDDKEYCVIVSLHTDCSAQEVSVNRCLPFVVSDLKIKRSQVFLRGLRKCHIIL